MKTLAIAAAALLVVLAAILFRGRTADIRTHTRPAPPVVPPEEPKAREAATVIPPPDTRHPEPTPEPERPSSTTPASALDRRIEARLSGRTAFDIVQLIQRDAGFACVYDAYVEQDLRSHVVNMEISGGTVRLLLDFLKDFLGFDVEYLNDTVWIRRKAP
jgi:hypothetical protein